MLQHKRGLLLCGQGMKRKIEHLKPGSTTGGMFHKWSFDLNKKLCSVLPKQNPGKYKPVIKAYFLCLGKTKQTPDKSPGFVMFNLI